MKKLLAVVAAAFALSACGLGDNTSGQPASTAPTTPSVAVAGPSNVFGLRLNLNPKEWQVFEAQTTALSLEYNPSGVDCQGQCSAMQIFTADSTFYSLKVAGGEFITETECAAGADSFTTAQEQTPFRIGGVQSRYYISSYCDNFKQGPPGGKNIHRFTWHLPQNDGRPAMLIEFVEFPSGIRIQEAGVLELLQDATWE